MLRIAYLSGGGAPPRIAACVAAAGVAGGGGGNGGVGENCAHVWQSAWHQRNQAASISVAGEKWRKAANISVISWREAAQRENLSAISSRRGGISAGIEKAADGGIAASGTKRLLGGQ